jgi:hypothetical protein
VHRRTLLRRLALFTYASPFAAAASSLLPVIYFAAHAA